MVRAFMRTVPSTNGARGAQLRDIRRRVTQLRQHLVGMLAEQRRPRDRNLAVGQADGIGHGHEGSALGMLHLDQGAALAQRGVVVQILHAEDGPARHVDPVEEPHRLDLLMLKRPFLDDPEAVVEMGDARLRGGVLGMFDQLGPADQLHQRRPDLRLDDDVDIVVGAPALGAHGLARLAATGGIARARHLVAELRVWVFLERPMLEALLVAHLDAAEIEHCVLHRDLDALAASGLCALVEGGENAGDAMDAGARIADLRAGRGRWAVPPAGRAHRAAHGLGNRLIGLAIDIGARAEALDGGVDDPRVDLLDPLPGEALAVEHARRKILDQDVAFLEEPDEDLLPLRRLHVDGDAALVAVQHREIEAVRVRHVAQLGAGDVAAARQLDLDHVGPEPGEDLSGRRAGLDVRHVQNADPIQSLAHFSLPPEGSGRRLIAAAGPMSGRHLYMVWFMVPGA
jgi:hypothetical protein